MKSAVLKPYKPIIFIIIILSLFFAMNSVFGQSPQVLNPTADSYIYITNPDTNYGTSTRLEVDGSPITKVYFKFDLSSLAGKTISLATLKFYIVNPSNHKQELKRLDDDSWTETGIKYNNAPALGSVLKVIDTGNQNNVWYEIDITSYVDENK